MADEFQSVGNIFKRPRPSAAGITDTAILEIERGNAARSQSGAEVRCMLKVVTRAPVAAVNVHQQRMRGLRRFSGGGQAQIAELVLVRAVFQARVVGRLLASKNVVSHAVFASGNRSQR